MLELKITDNKALSRINHHALAIYAESLGYTRSDTHGENAFLYTAPNKPELIIPNKEGLDDHARVVYDLIERFSDQTYMNQLDVYQELSMVDLDMIKILGYTLDSSGMPPIQAASQFLQGISNLFVRCMIDVGDNNDNNLRKLRDNIRMLDYGPRGLSITAVTAHIPNPTEKRNIAKSIDRRFTSYLASVLHQIRDTLNMIQTTDHQVDSLNWEHRLDISPLIYMALGHIITTDHTPQTNISIKWAKTNTENRQRVLLKFYSSEGEMLNNLAESVASKRSRKCQ